MTELAKIASEGLAFLTKINPNHGEDGRFTGGPASAYGKTSISRTSRFVSPDGKTVDAAAARYSRNDSYKHEKGLSDAARHFDGLHKDLRTAGHLARMGEVDADRIAKVGEQLGEHAQGVEDGVRAADAIRAKNGDKPVGLHDVDREALGHASTLAAHIKDSPEAVKAAWDVGARYS